MNEPIYNAVMTDLGIDPKREQGHEVRVTYIIHKYPSLLLGKNGRINTKPQKKGRRS